MLRADHLSLLSTNCPQCYPQQLWTNSKGLNSPRAARQALVCNAPRSLLRCELQFKVRPSKNSVRRDCVIEIIQAAGWPIWPILLCSVIAIGIIGERFYSMRHNMVAPRDLLPRVIQEYRQNGVSSEMLNALAA